MSVTTFLQYPPTMNQCSEVQFYPLHDPMSCRTAQLCLLCRDNHTVFVSGFFIFFFYLISTW